MHSLIQGIMYDRDADCSAICPLPNASIVTKLSGLPPITFPEPVSLSMQAMPHAQDRLLTRLFTPNPTPMNGEAAVTLDTHLSSFKVTQPINTVRILKRSNFPLDGEQYRCYLT